MGKISFDELRDIIRCIRKTDEVVVSPMPGFDAGVHEIGNGMCIVIATDPCVNVPVKWFGWLLIHYSASDVAMFGAKPKFCTINLLGPLGTKKETFKKIMKKTCHAADDLGITIITGHTGRYKGLTTMLGTCTSYGMIQKERLITPAGAKPGDYIIVIKPLGLETLTNFVLTHKSLATDLFGSRKVINLAGQIKQQTCVEEALLLASFNVSAMHDVTEGGLIATLNEMAYSSNVGFSVNYTDLPITSDVLTLADHFNLSQDQVLSISSTGNILAAVSLYKKDEIIDVFSKRGFDARIIGVFSKGKERFLECDGSKRAFPRAVDDPYSRILN